MGLLSFLFGLTEEPDKKKKRNSKLEKEMDAYDLEEWQKNLVRKGEFDVTNFDDDEDDLEEEDYYNDD